MPVTPWRIAAQSYTVLDPDTKEPAFTLQFIVDHQQADVMKLRMTPSNPDGSALEMEFSTGGFVIGTPVKQPRWLKAFERPDPNLYLGDDKAAKEYREGLSEDQRASYDGKRKSFLDRRKAFEDAHGKTAAGPGAAGAKEGPDDTDPNSPEAERLRSKAAGLDTTQPADADRKGMASQPAGGQAGEVASQAAGRTPDAPNAVDQQRQRQGQPAKTLEEINAEEVEKVDKRKEAKQTEPA